METGGGKAAPMKSMSILILLSALTAMGVGVLLLYVSAEVPGVSLPGLGVFAGGVGLLILWVKRHQRWEELTLEQRRVRTDPAGKRFAWMILVISGFGFAVLGAIQGFSGEYFNRGTNQMVQDPGGAWRIGGAMIGLGLLAVGIGVMWMFRQQYQQRWSGDGETEPMKSEAKSR